MNPLSAIRQMIPGLALPGAPAAAGAGAIPAAELQQLGGMAPPVAVPSVKQSGPSQSIAVSGAGGSGSFSNVLENLVGDVNRKQQTASSLVHDLQSGQNVSLHQTMIALEEASVSFQLMVEVRNKVLESYQEMMRMQV